MTNNKQLFLKWTKNLYNVQLVLLICVVLAEIPLVGAVFGLISNVLSLVVVYILYQLAPVNDRYRKAAMFLAVALIGGVITYLMKMTVIASLVVVICSLVGIYQEYKAHSDMLDGIDNSLAKKWHSLFNWEIFGGMFLGALLTPVIVLLTVLLVLEENLLTAITLVAATGFNLILDVAYLTLLKRTRTQYEAFPENMGEEQSVDFI